MNEEKTDAKNSNKNLMKKLRWKKGKQMKIQKKMEGKKTRNNYEEKRLKGIL